MMGADAYIMVIGPSKTLAKYDVLMYSQDWYDLEANNVVIGYVCGVNTTGASQQLALLCCTELSDVDNHIVKKVELGAPDWDDLEANNVSTHDGITIQRLLDEPDVTVWFIPDM